jgi:WD40 repeat protein
MVSFHQESQRLAVGTKDAAIVIYDLKTATRWHVLEGHKSAVTAVAFAYSGKMLASYSLEDAEVRFWATTSSFFGILGSAPHCLRVIQVNPVNSTNLTPFVTYFDRASFSK